MSVELWWMPFGRGINSKNNKLIDVYDTVETAKVALKARLTRFGNSDTEYEIRGGEPVSNEWGEVHP